MTVEEAKCAFKVPAPDDPEHEYSVRFEVPATIRARSRDEANAKKDRIADRVQRRVRTLRGFRSAVVEAGPAEETEDTPTPSAPRPSKRRRSGGRIGGA